jgi:hypothetical protein
VIRKMLARLTYANVLATVAVVLAMGGTAAAAFIINSNADVAPGTISGHNPPGGDHANIIGQSVSAGDLATNAVTGAKVADNAITSPKIANHAVMPQDLATVARGARAYGYYPNFLSLSKNVVAVTNPDDGDYCIKLAPSIDTSKATLIPSPEFGSDNTSEGGDQVAHAEWVAFGTECPAGQMQVRTWLDEQKTKVQNVSGCVGCTVNDTYRDLVRVDQGFSFVVP